MTGYEAQPHRKGTPAKAAHHLPVPSQVLSNVLDPAQREHLFISYAWENCALADWLVRQLTSHGYRVWCDRFQMLGGEPFPKVIDEAIKMRTFRLIALLSKFSLQKPSPRKERTLALNLGREWGIDFMIPLNVDGLKPSELPWDYSDLTYIPFQDWAAGLDQLLRALGKAGAPRPLTEEEGRKFAAETFLPQHIVESRTEALLTNCFVFERIPERLRTIRWHEHETRPDLDRLPVIWPYYQIDGGAIAFTPPPPKVPQQCYALEDETFWRTTELCQGARSRDVVANLLWQSLAYTLLSRGLRRDLEKGLIYFRRGLVPKNKIKYVGQKGRKTWVAVIGEKRFRGKPYRYHLAPEFQIRQDLGEDFVAVMKVRVFLTDIKGRPLDHASNISRRKHLTSSWFNHHWLSRVLAISSFLSRGKSQIVLLSKDDPVILDAVPISGKVNRAINEANLRSLRQEIAANTTGWDEDEGESETQS